MEDLNRYVLECLGNGGIVDVGDRQPQEQSDYDRSYLKSQVV